MPRHPQHLTIALVDLDGTRYRLRTNCAGHAAHALQAAGVAIPTAVTTLGPTPDRNPPPDDPAAVAV